MKIAVVGAGIAGLSCAYLLQRAGHTVTLFEKEARFGGHAHTHSVATDAGELPVDSGFLVFNHRTYPRFLRLLRALGIREKPSDMSFGASCERCRVEYSSRGMRGLFATRRTLRSPAHWRMLWDIPRFHRHGRAFLEAPDESWTLRRFLDAHAYGESFRRHFILPMAGAVWSSSFGGALNFSAATFLRFFDNHGWLTLTGAPRWMTIEGGSRTYVSRIVESLGANARRNASVYRVSRRGPKDGGGVEIAAASGSERFDHAVLACHADEALALITAPSPDEGAALSSFSYSFNRTLLHRDASFLPARTDAWASWNTQIRDCRDDEAPVSMTYHVNRLQSIGGATQYNVTLNPRRDPKDVVAEMAYRHPLLDKKATDAQPMVRALSGRDRISYAGAYLYNGFHEDGVRAALDACAPFGATL